MLATPPLNWPARALTNQGYFERYDCAYNFFAARPRIISPYAVGTGGLIATLSPSWLPQQLRRPQLSSGTGSLRQPRPFPLYSQPMW